MADSCCKIDTACCEPPALVLPGRPVPAARSDTCRTEADTCCPKGVPVFDGVNPRYKRILWTVIGINGVMFLSEMAAAQLAGSQALKADALDFLADTVTYGLSLAVIGASLRTRATAALGKGVSLFLMALWVFGSMVYQTLILGLPRAEVMGVIGVLALVANLASVLLLRPYKDGDANVRSVWLCSRNDAIGNVIVMGAALGVWGSSTAWPDLAVAAVMAGIFLTSSVQILRQAWKEHGSGPPRPDASSGEWAIRQRGHGAHLPGRRNESGHDLKEAPRQHDDREGAREGRIPGQAEPAHVLFGLGRTRRKGGKSR